MLIATKSSRINISEERNTKSIAEIVSNNIKVGDVLFFNGDLGVGKTTFIKYLINFLQKKNNQSITEIPSPTFNLVIEYQIDDLLVKHFDLYRIKYEKELINLGIFESLAEQITLVEWPKLLKLKNIEKKIDLFFEYNDNFNERFLTISSNKNYPFINEI